MSKLVAYLFAGALLYQTFHWIEHGVQMYQHVLLSWPAAHSHGILFFLDFEWNHFVFNTGYLIVLIIVLYLLHRSFPSDSAKDSARIFLWIGVFLQGYHEIEHVIKIWQHITTSCEPCPGILGNFFDGVYVHFIFNTVVLILPAITFFAYGFPIYLMNVVQSLYQKGATNHPKIPPPL